MVFKCEAMLHYTINKNQLRCSSHFFLSDTVISTVFDIPAITKILDKIHFYSINQKSVF